MRTLKLIQGFYKPNKYSCKNATGIYHILQNEIDLCTVKVNYLEGTALRQESTAQNRLFMSCLGKTRPATVVNAIQIISGPGETTVSGSGATVGGRFPQSPRKGRKRGYPRTVPFGQVTQKPITFVIATTLGQQSCPLCWVEPGTLGH